MVKWVESMIQPLTFFLILWALLEPKCSRRTTVWLAAGYLLLEAGVQIVIFMIDNSPELVYTLLPLTWYIPAIAFLHALSKNGFLPTAFTWLLALLCDQLLNALRKLLIFTGGIRGGWTWQWISCGILALAATLLLLLVFRVLRKPFLTATSGVGGNWTSVLFLLMVMLALFSYFLSSTVNATVIILLFFTALSTLFALVRLTASIAEEQRARATRLQMNALQRDYEILQEKLVLDRSYRHDLRHHMAALSALLQQGDCDEAQRYIADWQGQLSQVEIETWCRNTAVNGVLSAYLTQAKEAGCQVEAEVSLPAEFSVSEVDLCVALANALENAVHACEEVPANAPRRLSLSITLTDNRRLTIQVENSCHKSVTFDGEGFPVVPHREGHGQGLRNIAAVAEKYHGLFQCDCHDGMFTLRLVLLDASTESRRPRRAPAIYTGIFLCLFLLNCSPTVAQALERVPVLGQIVRVVDLRTYSAMWGSSGIMIKEPTLGGAAGAAGELNAQKSAIIEKMAEQFAYYAARKDQGYVGADIDYEVVRDDEALFTLRFTAALNAGGSVNYSRFLTLDKSTGQVLSLSDLFQPGVNYIFPISREIEAQMAEQVKAGQASYFLPGGSWPPEECFQSIDSDQDFYINEDGQLVIVFQEYEVAPGSAGTPEFTIPAETLNGLLLQPSVLR